MAKPNLAPIICLGILALTVVVTISRNHPDPAPVPTEVQTPIAADPTPQAATAPEPSQPAPIDKAKSARLDKILGIGTESGVLSTLDPSEKRKLFYEIILGEDDSLNDPEQKWKEPFKARHHLTEGDYNELVYEGTSGNWPMPPPPNSG